MARRPVGVPGSSITCVSPSPTFNRKYTRSRSSIDDTNGFDRSNAAAASVSTGATVIAPA